MGSPKDHLPLGWGLPKHPPSGVDPGPDAAVENNLPGHADQGVL